MTWAVLCDFDHTITTEDVTDRLLETHALPEWRGIEALWEQGFIGSGLCMKQQAATLRATPQQVDALADSIAIDPHFKAFASLCASRRIPLVIVSDGLDYVIERILERHGIHHLTVIASHFSYAGGNRWDLASPFASSGCISQQSTCKCEMSRQFRATTGADRILYIGDGRSDYCVSLQDADFILAKSSLLTYCQQQQLPHEAFGDFAQASRILSRIIQHQDAAPPRSEETLYA